MRMARSAPLQRPTTFDNPYDLMVAKSETFGVSIRIPDLINTSASGEALDSLAAL
jgi:hypothetical protein